MKKNKYKAESKLAQKANKILWACERKIKYSSESEASCAGFRVYKCAFCDGYHRASLVSKFIAKDRKDR